MTFNEYINVNGIVLRPNLPLIRTNSYKTTSYLRFQDFTGGIHQIKKILFLTPCIIANKHLGFEGLRCLHL